VPPISTRVQERPPQVGLRVTLDPSLPCGRCYPCRLGRYNCCANLRVIGVHAPGALAEYFSAPLAGLHYLPDSLDDEVGVMVEPLSIGVQAVTRSRLAAREKCLIIGAGTIGLSVLLVAAARGGICAVSDPCESRLALARQLGATVILNPAEGDLTEAAADLTEGEGPAVVFEVVGRPQTVLQAVELVAAAGRVVQVGLCSAPLTFPGNIFLKKELDFLGSRLHCGTVPQAVKLIASGAINPEPLITHRMALEEAEQGLRLMAERPEEVVKIVLRP